MSFPSRIDNEPTLEDLLSTPTDAAIEALRQCDGDVIILGVAGKMGPSLAGMVKRASDAIGAKRRIIGVSRFGSAGAEDALKAQGIETIRADLLDPIQLGRLPDAPNIIYMAGMKFGSTGQECADLGDERVSAGHGFSAVSHQPDRGVLDGECLRAHDSRSRWIGRE